MAPGNTSSGSRQRQRSTQESAGRDTVGANGDGADHDADEDGDDRANLPAVRERPARRPSPLMRYADIPGELTEALRSIVNRHELRTGEPIPDAVAVTSSVPGEGVTTVSQALATLIAQEMERFVCWVDCSWLRPGGIVADGSQPDLLDLLENQSEIHSAFQTTAELPNLISLAPGPVPESKRNLIVRSPGFEGLLRALADEFDHVVFDLPPVLSNAASLAVLRQADASLFVARHRSTTVPQLRRALDSTEPTPNIGVVLNRFRPSAPRVIRRLIDA